MAGPESGALRAVERALAQGRLSARGVDRVLRISWTLADLSGRDRPGTAEGAQALGLRMRGSAGRAA